MFAIISEDKKLTGPPWRSQYNTVFEIIDDLVHTWLMGMDFFITQMFQNRLSGLNCRLWVPSRRFSRLLKNDRRGILCYKKHGKKSRVMRSYTVVRMILGTTAAPICYSLELNIFFMSQMASKDISVLFLRAFKVWKTTSKSQNANKMNNDDYIGNRTRHSPVVITE